MRLHWIIIILIAIALVSFFSGKSLAPSLDDTSRWLVIQEGAETWYAVHITPQGYDAGLKFVDGEGWNNLPEGSIYWKSEVKPY